MKLKNYKCANCENTEFFMSRRGEQIGVYCLECGRYLKWANPSEVNLFLKEKGEIEEESGKLTKDGKIFIANCPSCNGLAAPVNCSEGARYKSDSLRLLDEGYVSCTECGLTQSRVCRTIREAIGIWNIKSKSHPVPQETNISR